MDEHQPYYSTTTDPFSQQHEKLNVPTTYLRVYNDCYYQRAVGYNTCDANERTCPLLVYRGAGVKRISTIQNDRLRATEQ
jgi:hypothetical protein